MIALKLRSRAPERLRKRLPGKEAARVERTCGTTRFEWRLHIWKGTRYVWKCQAASSATDGTWRKLPALWRLETELVPPATRAAAEKTLADLVQAWHAR